MSEINRRSALAAAMLAGGMAAIGGTAQAQPSRRARKAPDMAAQLDKLVSRHAIEEVLYAYARGNDLNDPAMVRACFWPESTHKHGGFDGTSTAFVDFAAGIWAKLKYSAHHISNVSIRIDGNRAFSECYYLAHHRRDAKAGGGEEDVFFEGRYLDLFERRGDEWRIIRRRGISDFTSPAMPSTAAYATWPAGTHTERSKDDEYYRMLQAFEAK